MHISSLYQAEQWRDNFLNWCNFWSDFLDEKSYIDGKYVYTHERLRKARRAIISLLQDGYLFTYLDPELSRIGKLPRTNNRIEGGVNAQLRRILRDHHGMCTTKRIKAIFWWCYMKTECPMSASKILKTMPRDRDIERLQKEYDINIDAFGGPKEFDTGLLWTEFHTRTLSWDFNDNQ